MERPEPDSLSYQGETRRRDNGKTRSEQKYMGQSRRIDVMEK